MRIVTTVSISIRLLSIFLMIHGCGCPYMGPRTVACLTAKDDNFCYYIGEQCYNYKKKQANCDDGKAYHCIRNVNTGKFQEGCFETVNCTIGTEPLVEFLPEPSVICRDCNDSGHYNPYNSTPSNMYSECNRTKDQCTAELKKFLCKPESNRDMFTKPFLCRCDVRRGYGRYGNFNRSQPVCSHEQYYNCEKVCRNVKEPDVLLDGYKCAAKCQEGYARTDEYSDDCIPMSTTRAVADIISLSHMTSHVPQATAQRPAKSTTEKATIKTTSHVPRLTSSSTEPTTREESGSNETDNRKDYFHIVLWCAGGFALGSVVVGLVVRCRKKIQGCWQNSPSSTHGGDSEPEVIPMLPTDDSASFINFLEDMAVTEGKTVTLECKLNKSNIPVNWLKDDQEIQPNDHIKLFVEQQIHKLVITDATLKDTARYSCFCGDVRTECTLRVQEDYQNKILQLREEQRQDLKTKVIAKCWIRLIEDMRPNEICDHLLENGMLNALHIKDISGGVCDPSEKNRKILNGINTLSWKRYCNFKYILMKVGLDMCVQKLEEFEKTVYDEKYAATFSIILKDMTVMEGEKVTLECELNKPNIPVKWLKKNQEIEPNDHIKLFVEQQFHKLVITNATLEDTARYSCFCGDVSTECTLRVQDQTLNADATSTGRSSPIVQVHQEDHPDNSDSGACFTEQNIVEQQEPYQTTHGRVIEEDEAS